MAIAANLHIPYRIEIGVENIEYLNIKDKNGKGKVSCFFRGLSINYRPSSPIPGGPKKKVLIFDPYSIVIRVKY